jgi:ABC-type Na+ efflux pump permease subunit
MFWGTIPLMERSLRIDARGWGTHLIRLGLMGAIYGALCFALLTQDLFGAPGLRFFRGITHLDAMFLTLLGVGFFSTTVTEEKEEDTLGLMLLAGISPLGLLAGKSVGRIWQALLLVAIQCPFMLLAVTMGGVTLVQVWSATVALLAYMIFLAGFGLLCSTLAHNNRTAGKYMVLGLVAYVLIPSIARGLLSFFARLALAGVSNNSGSNTVNRILESVGEVCVFLRMEDILATGFGQSPWSVQVISNIAMGIVSAGLSLCLFGFATRNPATEATSRGLVARQRKPFRFSAGRSGSNPFVWKDFHFVSGGIGALVLRTIFYVGVCALVLGLGMIGILANGPGNSVGACLMILSFCVVIDAGLVLSKSMHDEVRGQTLSSLLMLPRSSTEIIYSKFLGSLLGWLPGPILLLTFTLSTEYGRRCFSEILRNQAGGWCVVMLFLLIPHFAPLVALYVRWGAVPLAIGMAFGAYFAVIAGMYFAVPMRSQATMDGYLFFATLMMISICVGCHIGILLRVQTLGTR